MIEWNVVLPSLVGIVGFFATVLKIWGPKKEQKNVSSNGESTTAKEVSNLRERIVTLEEGLKNTKDNLKELKRYTEGETSKIWRNISGFEDGFKEFVGDVRGRIGQIVGKLENLDK